ncbi:uncharacterized protein LOC136031372 [Artemia franciscana]|uniref:SWIM-type domain-containing protein n=1 Tax=Artemia franciscana TaxID=6661 RepID=A0AA88HCS4_ARTSF|nr:hypothetical protein QYM36_017215 [Artemia franciscana]
MSVSQRINHMELISTVTDLIRKLDYPRILQNELTPSQPELLLLHALLGATLLDALALFDSKKFSFLPGSRKSYYSVSHGYQIHCRGGPVFLTDDISRCTCQEFRVSVLKKKLNILCTHQLMALLVIENPDGDRMLNSARLNGLR